MEKKDYEFIAFNGRNERIKLKLTAVFNGITEETANYIRWGIEVGLAQKYNGAYVTFREI